MARQKPIVLADDPAGAAGQPMLRRLQSGEDLDAPLVERVVNLERLMRAVAIALAEAGLDINDELGELL